MDSRPLGDFIVHLLAHLLAEEELLIHEQPSSRFDSKHFL
jgi:hypothetical protein